ncbi:MAG TPA: hypothetical protein VEJ84_07475 [Acidimicrobiales bacterium]|nr:hypothetical protein [Acidimicrobiales bacterium]
MSNESAIRKFDEFYQNLEPDEQRCIASMVRSSLYGAAAQYANTDVTGYTQSSFFSTFTGTTAPNVVAGLGLPGALAAHGIPGCAASALEELNSQINKGNFAIL